MNLDQRLRMCNLSYCVWSKTNDWEGWEDNPQDTEAKLAKAMEDLTGLWQEIQSQGQASNPQQP